MAQHAAKGSGKITSAQNPLTGATVKHSAKRWAQINRQYQQKYGPLNLTGPMSPFDVKTSIDAATHQKFDPQYQTLNKQTSASNQQDKNLTDWYAQYRQQLDAATAKSQQAQQGAQNFTQGFADSSSALDAQQRQKLQADNQASAAQRGATVDPNQAFTGQQADQSRRQALGQFGALQAQTGADTTAYMADKSRIASGSELQAHQAEGTRRQGISELVRQLQGQEGDYRTTLRGQLQQSERQNNLANATFGLNTQKAAASAQAASTSASARQHSAAETARHNRAQERLTAQRDQRAAAKDRYQYNHHLGPYAPPRSTGGGRGGGGGGGSGGGPTPTQRRTATQNAKNARNFLGSYRIGLPDGSSRGLNYTWDFTGAGYQNTVDTVRRNAHVPYDVARKAVDDFMRRTWPSRFGGSSRPYANRPTQVH